MKRRRKRILSLLLAADMLSGSMLAGGAVMAEGSSIAGTPYTDAGAYDVEVPHVFINQVYGGGNNDDAAVTNGFVELYNPTDANVDLTGWSLQIADPGKDHDNGVSGDWTVYNLEGTIKAHSSYLVIGEETTAPEDASYDISGLPRDASIAREINNNGIKVALMSNRTKLAVVNPFAEPKPEGYVDLVGTGSHDDGSKIDGYETAFPSGEEEGTSKKIAIRRIDLQDTDNNRADFEQIDYDDIDDNQLSIVGPRSGADGEWGYTVPELGIAGDGFADATAGALYSVTASVYGGKEPYVYAAAGLPAGLSMNPATGTISGTPGIAGVGEHTVKISVADSSEPVKTASRELPLTVKQPPTDYIADKLSVEKIGEYKVGDVNADGGVAEIVKYNKDNGNFYLVNGSANPPTLDIASLAEVSQRGAGQQMELHKTASIEIEKLVDSDDFRYGDLTSVDVNTATKRVAVAVQEADYAANGKILVLDYDGKLLKSYEAGVQPDMIKFTTDGKYILTADEGEPRLNDKGDPPGSVTIVDTTTDEVTHVTFDDSDVIADNVHIRGASDDKGQVTGSSTNKADAVRDMEPEYIALSADETKAYVSLQENNAVGTIDIAAKKVLSVDGLGIKDLSDPNNALDLVKDGQIKLENVPFYGMYMPDGIASYTIDGKPYLFTANEGDVTEWPLEGVETDWPGRYTSAKLKDIKDKLNPDSDAAKFLAAHADDKGKTPYDGVEVATDMGNDSIYMFGARSFSIWNADTLEQVFDSGNDFEKITGQRLPGFFNASNDDADLDSRSPKKGPEPEYVAVGKVGSNVLAFTGLERTGGIMTYNVTDPEHPVFENYLNTRDFTLPENHLLETDSGPEGLDFIPAAISPTGLPLLLVANEVGGTVAVLQLNVTKVTIDKTSLALEKGDEGVKLSAVVAPVGGGEAKVTWSSSDSDVATVSEDGIVTPVGAGDAVITAISADGYGSDETAVTVTNPSGGGAVYYPPVSNPDNGDQDGGAEQPKGQIVLDAAAVQVTNGTDANGRQIANVTIDAEALSSALSDAKADAGDGQAKVVIDLGDVNGAASVSLPAAALVEAMKRAGAVIVVTTAEGSYELPLDALASAQLPEGDSLEDVQVVVTIAPIEGDDLESMGDSAEALGAKMADGASVEFKISVIANGTERELNSFGDRYVSRTVYLPSADGYNDATGAMYDPETGEFSFVPGLPATIDGKAAFELKRPGNSLYTVLNYTKDFADMTGHWAEADVEKMASKLIVEGIDDTHFAPGQAVTRAEFTALLVRALGLDQAADAGFADVPGNAWYAGSVGAAVKAGLVTGTEPGVFAPADQITRAQMAVMVARAIEFAGGSGASGAGIAALDRFADRAAIPQWAAEQAALLVGSGIMEGNANGAFSPADSATRAQAAVLLLRALQSLDFIG